MKLIQDPPPPSIGPNSSVDFIVNLQEVLLFLLEKGRIQLPDEIRQVLMDELHHDHEGQVYGTGTSNIVIAFRKQFQLEPGEIVDEPAAKELNKLLRELGAFDTPATEWVVRGQIVDASGPLNDILVGVFDRDLFFRRDGANTGQLLGNGNTQKLPLKNEDGWFEFSYTTSKFAAGDKSQKPAESIPDLIFALSRDGQPLEKFQIYRLPDGKEVTEETLASEDDLILGIQARKVEEVRIVIGSVPKRELSEFELLIQAIEPLLPERAPAGADATQIEALVGAAMLRFDEEQYRDVSFAARETGFDRSLIEQLKEAFKQAAGFENVPAWAFFGLATHQLSLDRVTSMSLEELVSALKPLQPSYDQRDLESVANSLKQFVQEYNIQVKITDLKTSVGDLLQPILASEAKVNSFLDAYARHEGDIESFWKDMGQNPGFQEVIPQIQINLQLSQLTLNNNGLITALQQVGIKNTRQLVDIPTEQWDALALENKAGIPLHITGKDDLERSKKYSQELQTLVEITFPTDVIKKSIQKPEVNAFLNNNPTFDFTLTPVEAYLQDQGDQAFQGIENHEAVKTHLRQTQRLYTLTANAADMNVLMDMEYESAHQIAKLSVEDFSQSLAGKVTAENAQLYHAKALAVSDASAIVYQQLRDLAGSHSFSAAKNLSDDFNAPTSFNFTNNPNAASNVLPGIPDWESLFGSLDMCECQQCKSVYSPAAYFVDLLHILLGQNKGAPRIEIFRRRPDLKYTKLSCEHTDTLIPYIDLVNEVLETYVAQDTVGDNAASIHAKDSTNDTSNFTALDLAANPQHPNPESLKDAATADDKLKSAIFPLNLPFDMDLEVARQFLQEQNSSRFEVLDAFKIASSNAIDSERLGISSREFEILTLKQLDGVSNAIVTKADGTTRDLNTNDLWGNPIIPAGGSLGEVLVKVRNFLDHTAIAYTDLIDLLKTRFLNPNFPINVFLQELSEPDRTTWLAAHPTEDQLALQVIELEATNPEAPCDLNTTQIQHLNGQFLSDEELSRINRFIRLWKKLGCTITELDGLLIAVGANDLTPQVIQDLSGLWQVQQDLTISLDRAAVLIGNIPTYGKDSLFARLFLNKAILQIDDNFFLRVDQSEVDLSAELLESHVPAILAALQISEEDFNRIVAYTSLNIAVDTLTVANLSKIYRYVIFAKGLRLKIKDLITWFDLIPQAPWITVDELVKAKEILEKLNRYGFKAADFAYIFNKVTVAGTMLPPKDEIITQSAKTLREGLQKIQQENTATDGIVTNDFLKRALGNVLDVEEATKIIGILDGTNTLNTFNYLLTPKIPEKNYEIILQNYLIPADIVALAATTDVPERLKKYWDKIEVRLLPVLKQTFIQQHLTAAFKAESALITYFLEDTAILQTCLDIETVTPASEKAYIDLYVLFNNCLWLIEKLKLSEKELSYFQGNASFNNFNWKALNFATWLRIADFVALRDSLPVAEKDLLSIFEIAKTAGAIDSAIIDVTGWDKANVKLFVSKLLATDFLNEISLIVLQKQIELSRLIGVSIEKLESWANDSVTHSQAQDIKRSLKTKYDESAWIDVSTQVHNRIRNHLRDALVAYLLQKSEIKAAGLKDTNDLYGYFLIDVEMDACMLTSRLKQAIASIQLFVQRCLLNLESHKIKPEQVIPPNLIDAKQWQWMKNYRVWEANRKVFLYPENWIEPELRDNKSPFFKELESELLQGEVTNENVEKALMNYLEKLHDVGRLDICGTYEDNDAQELHVFGRTFNSPPQYFYRKLDLKTQVWTAWEKVQLDIQSNEEGDSAGVHLIPIVWNRRLYLIWPILSQKILKSTISSEQKYWQIKIGFSEYRNYAWVQRRVSNFYLQRITDEDLVAVNAAKIRFNLRIIDSSLEIDVVMTGNSSNRILGKFVFNDAKNTFESFQLDVDESSILTLPSQENFYQALQSKEVGLKIISSKSTVTEILRSSERPPKVLNAIVQEADNALSPFIYYYFFYQDRKRNYYVEPQFYLSTASLQNPGKSIISPSKLDFAKSLKTIDKGDPVPFQKADKFEQLSARDISRIVENGQIATSTAMQIRSMQTLKAPAAFEIQTQSLSFAASNIGQTYLNSHIFNNTKLQFKLFFHAYVCKFMGALNKNGIEGLLNLYNQQLSDLQFTFTSGGIGGGLIPTGITNNFVKFYLPNKVNVDTPYPLEEVDFSPSGAYSLYNWELFFHVPMLLANRLSKNQRFEEAMRWYHFVFNPTTNDSLSSSARYWQVIPFRNTDKETLEVLFKQLEKPASDPKRRELEDTITAWRNNPFNPHLIARMRLCAYKKNTVMKYLDNLIAWADNLFRQDTIESINEATQLYILAAELLGKRPEKIPERGTIKALNYAELEKTLDAFSNALVNLETIFPFYNLQAVPQGVQGTAPILNTTASTLYFCLPDNDKLLGYWDTVGDRLFKIRHCQNIEGIERQLALFEPPIDPALLVQAVAGGVDISSVLADLNSPLPYYRFNYIVMKALESCAELKSLGNSLLSALEKKDVETLSMMRTQHETLLLSLAKTVRKLQITEAQRGREGLEKTRLVTEFRANFYTQLLKDGLNSSEKEHQTLGFASMALSLGGQFLEMAASAAHAVPDMVVGGMAGAGGGPITINHVGGGDKTANALSAFGRFVNMLSAMTSFAANSAQTNAGYQRRADDWKLQQNLAYKELAQIDKQILAAQIREQIAEQELINHEQQIDNAHQVEDFYRNKYTQEELYGWMVGEISTIYFQCYQLAYDLAKKAEKTYRYELGLPTSNFVQFGIWDSFRKGLMSGEKLYLCLKQMEKSYMDQNRREYEITKNISLVLHDPMALITLKETGSCELVFPETLFDVDYPGHYMRRIKSVSITIPCVVGPYTSINCILTLLSSETRVKSTPQTPYAKLPNDNRFVQNFAAMQSIAASHAQNDSGLFELNFRDERYLPFEGSGVISRWRIELPYNIQQFDYQTISDVVLHLKYTARDGGKSLHTEAEKGLNEVLKADGDKIQSRLFSLRHEFPTEWHKFVSTADNVGNHSQSFSFDKQRFPMVFKNGEIRIKTVDIFGNPKIPSKNAADIPSMNTIILSSPDGQIQLKKATNIGLFLTHQVSDSAIAVDIVVKNLGPNKNEADWTIRVNKLDVSASLEKLEDIFVLLHYIVVMT